MSDYEYEEIWPKMHKDLKELVGTPYRYGVEVRADKWPPKALDCSELVELIFARQGIPCPDGSYNQHAATVRTMNPRPGDLGFFAKFVKIRPGNPHGIYHVGVLFSDKMVVEARAKDKQGRFGRVIYRPRRNWESYEPFKQAGGWRRLQAWL